MARSCPPGGPSCRAGTPTPKASNASRTIFAASWNYVGRIDFANAALFTGRVGVMFRSATAVMRRDTLPGDANVCRHRGARRCWRRAGLLHTPVPLSRLDLGLDGTRAAPHCQEQA